MTGLLHFGVENGGHQRNTATTARSRFGLGFDRSHIHTPALDSGSNCAFGHILDHQPAFGISRWYVTYVTSTDRRIVVEIISILFTIPLGTQDELRWRDIELFLLLSAKQPTFSAVFPHLFLGDSD